MRNFITAFFLLVLLASVSAFTLTATIPQQEINGEMYYALDAPLDRSSSVLLEGNITQVNAKDNFSNLFHDSIGNYSVKLTGIEPTVLSSNGNCSQRCCSGNTGPKVTISVADSTGRENYPAPGNKTFFKAVNTDYSQCSKKVNDTFISGQNPPLIVTKITKIEAPEFQGTRLPGTYSDYYVIKEGDSPEITVEFCIEFLLKSGLRSECIFDLSELMELDEQEEQEDVKEQGEEDETDESQTDESDSIAWPPIIGTPGSVQNDSQTISERIRLNTDDSIASTDDAVQSTNGANTIDDSAKMQACTSDLHRNETLFIAKTRFDYEKIGVNNSRGYTNFTSSMIEDKQEIIFGVSGIDGFDGEHSFYLDGFKPEKISGTGTVLTSPSFHSFASSGIQMNCGTAFKGLNEEGHCSPRDEIKPNSIIWKVYKYEAPFFQEATQQEKQLYGKNELLREGQHCYDVWAYYAFRFKLGTGETADYSPWIKSEEELESFIETMERGWNLRVTVVGVDGIELQGAKVKVSGEVNSEPWLKEIETNALGTADFIVPIGTELEITASKHNFRPSEPVSVIVEDKLEKEIVLLPGSYNMPLIFSTDDFWIMYNEVLPAFLEPAQKVTDITLPKDRDEKIEYLISNFDQPINEAKQSNLYGSPGDCVVCEFFWWQNESCDTANASRIPMIITDIYRDLEVEDYLGFEMKPYKVMVIQGLEYNKSYYSCTLIPTNGKINTLEVKWNIDNQGNIEWTDRRLLVPTAQ